MLTVLISPGQHLALHSKADSMTLIIDARQGPGDFRRSSIRYAPLHGPFAVLDLPFFAVQKTWENVALEGRHDSRKHHGLPVLS